MKTSIITGAPMLDTNGKRVQAHGGGVIVLDGTYYLYGENKEKSVEGAPIWHWGVRAYSSEDLVNWTDRGVIIPPVTDDEDSPLHPASQMDRPHILFNPRTKKFVCWLKIVGRNNIQSFTIMQADEFFGPYEMVATGYRPFGFSAGDFDLDIDEDTGIAYLFFEKIHTDIISCALTDDFLAAQEPYVLNLHRDLPPDAREAPVHFTRNGTHYLFTSGTTHYKPNPTEVAIADKMIGEYRTVGDLHPTDESRTSYGCQISDVIRVQGTELYIALGDRWVPSITDARPYLRQYRVGLRAIAKIIGLKRVQRMLILEKKPPRRPKPVKSYNTAMSDYVWLPIRFEGDRPTIDWVAEWSIEDYAAKAAGRP